MNLSTIKADQLAARKARDSARATLLTTLIGEIETALRKPDPKSEAEVIVTTVKAFVKRIDEFLVVAPQSPQSITLLVEREILEKYLPAQVSEDTIRASIKGQFPELTTKDKGSVMKFLKAEYQDGYDGATASKIFDSLLSS